MPSKVIPFPIGPFTGGINNSSDPTAIDDSEMWDCQNLEVELDGSLVCRPPILKQNGAGSWTDHIVMIGTATISGVNYIIGSNSQGTYAFDGNNWQTIKAGLVSFSAVQIRNLVYVIPTPSSGQSGGFWTPGGGFTTDNAMPRGEKGVFHKNRLWIVPGFSANANHSRLSFTDPIVSNTLDWPGTNFADVQPGDGQYLVDIAVYDDNLLLFKHTSTYVYAFDLNPTDGTIQVVNPVVGVSAKKCVVLYENTLFVFFQGHIYQVVNYAYNRVSDKLDLTFDSTSPGGSRIEEIFLSVLGDRLIFRFFNTVYVMSLRIGAWTTWRSKDSELNNFGPLVKWPTPTVANDQRVYYAGSSIANVTKVFTILDGHDAARTETIDCYLKTKIYDNFTIQGRTYIIADSAHYKKMAWWGASVQGNGNITGRANPLVASYQVKWSDVTNLLWPSQNTFIWNDPLSIPFAPSTTIQATGRVRRDFVKFLKTLRFHQIYFELTITTDGSPATGPCKVFGATAMLSQRQTASKQVT